MRLIIPILINCLLVLVIYLADKYTPAKNLSYMKKQIIIGVMFGCSSAFASSFGVEWLGTIVNVRDRRHYLQALFSVHLQELFPVLSEVYTAGFLCTGEQACIRSLVAVSQQF